MGITVEFFKNPEDFLLKRYYGDEEPKGFRIEIYVAKRFNVIRENLIDIAGKYCDYNADDSRFDIGKLANLFSKSRDKKKSNDCTKKRFCEYCEKKVIPKRTHKLDAGDIMLIFFTGGFWAFLLIALYLFMRRCPVCNRSLRGVKPNGMQ